MTGTAARLARLGRVPASRVAWSLLLATLAVGFGVKEKQDVDFLRGKADIAVVGSETLRVLERGGVAEVGPFLSSLR